MTDISVQYMDHMGTDLDVANAARVSMAKESDWADYGVGIQVLKQEDAKLIDYLARHQHWTPFAHTAIKFRVKAPIPIRTQCFKHKQGFVENEESRRYIKYEPEVFHPAKWRKAAANVKQGSSDEEIVPLPYTLVGFQETDEKWVKFEIPMDYTSITQLCVDAYSQMIEEGVCPEQARFILPQGCMVNWIWTGSLAAYARFYKQRTDPHAQYETQRVAALVGDQCSKLFPISWEALTKERI